MFWNDPEREFQITLDSLAMEGVTTLRLDQDSSLRVKMLLEQHDTEGKYLLYCPLEEPDYDSDWLLDIRLYSRSFRADRSSILLQDLGLKQQSLRSHLAERRKFFDSKDRLARLKSFIQPDDVAADIDRKMMAVIMRADHPELFCLVRTLFHGWLELPGVDLDTDPESFVQLEKFDLDKPFWEMTRTAFGYESDQPTLKNFLIRLLVTDFGQKLKGDCPQGLKNLFLPERGRDNTVVCLGQWKDSGTKGTSYDRLSAEVAKIVKLDNYLPNMELEALAEVSTFLRVEQEIAKRLRDRIRDTASTIVLEPIRALIGHRQVGYWATASLADNPEAPRSALHAVYEALLAAAEFFALWNQHQNMSFPNALACYRAYEGELFRFDQLYRHFMEASDLAEAKGWDIIKALRSDMEAHYTNGYLGSLAFVWGQSLGQEGDLLAKWNLGPVPNQYRFYERNIGAWLGDSESRRAFVIVSDAFRYEAAHELTELLNGRYRMEATLSSQLGVLPSYTALGMASLLPHKELRYKGTEVLVDGSPSGSAERSAIVEKVGGVAIKADDLMALKKDEGREFVRDKRVVYIYHDTVDAIGDDAKTETKTFEAVRKAIDELASLASHLVNNLNANYIVVTADHGFLYSESHPGETDKSKLESKPANALIAKKRYILGPNLPNLENAWHGTVKATASVQDEMEFLVPKGTNRFHFIGGARFVHGGAMLQEICVPVITIRHVRNDTKTRPVVVHVLGNTHRITTGVCRFQLLQMEPVGDRFKAVTLKVGIYEGGTAVSEVKQVKFDSATDNMDERKKWVTLTLTGKSFDKKKPYRLVLVDAESGIEQQSVEVIIDRAVSDDF